MKKKNNSEAYFMELVEHFTDKNKDVQAGRMMSSPGLKVNNKVFAFYSKGSMGFRLGPDFAPKQAGLKKPTLLNPFKTKGPLKGWYVVKDNEMDKWKSLTQTGLDFTRTLKK